MGGAGDLLSLSLNVPPWEELHELSREELRVTNLVTPDMVAATGSVSAGAIELASSPVQDRFRSSAVATTARSPDPARSSKSAEEMGRRDGVSTAETSLCKRRE
jgi:hypothetical protein